jgi:hypothetical protein
MTPASAHREKRSVHMRVHPPVAVPALPKLMPRRP